MFRGVAKSRLISLSKNISYSDPFFYISTKGRFGFYCLVFMFYVPWVLLLFFYILPTRSRKFLQWVYNILWRLALAQYVCLPTLIPASRAKAAQIII